MAYHPRLIALARSSANNSPPSGKAKVNRASRVSATNVARVTELIAAGRSDADIAFSLGLTRGQVYNIRKAGK